MILGNNNSMMLVECYMTIDYRVTGHWYMECGLFTFLFTVPCNLLIFLK